MSLKASGPCYETVKRRLHRLGVNTDTLQIGTLGSGSDHLVVLNDEVIGEYNHVSRRLLIYPEREVKSGEYLR